MKNNFTTYLIGILLCTCFLFTTVHAQTGTVSMTNTGSKVTVSLDVTTSMIDCMNSFNIWIFVPAGTTISGVTSTIGTVTPTTNMGYTGGLDLIHFNFNGANTDVTDTAAGSSIELFCFTAGAECGTGEQIRLLIAPGQPGFVNPSADLDAAIFGQQQTVGGSADCIIATGTTYAGNTVGADVITCPVPVELTTFTAATRSRAIAVEWESATELFFDGYELQRSLDGERFEKLAWVQGSENSLAEKQYDYLDIAVKGGVTYYYRLKMIDLDASYQYSPVRSAQIGAKGETMEVFPNPTSEAVRVTIDLPKEDRVHIRFYNATGKVALERVQDLKEGSNTLEFHLTDLPTGLYSILIAGSQIRATESVVVMD